MSVVKHWLKGCGRFMLPLIPALAIAAPAYADDWGTYYGGSSGGLNDSSQPGSAIVFPKFVKGTVAVDGVTLPATEIEVGITCPKNVPGGSCAEHEPVKIRFQWVCPGFQDFNQKLICHSNNFDVFGSVSGKIVFNPMNMTITGDNVVNVPTPPCYMGYLIGWVINPQNDLPVKFNGLVGDAVIRESATALSAYGAIPIQAANDAAPDSVFTSSGGTFTYIDRVYDNLTGGNRLAFDGRDNHYKAVTGTIIGDVKFTNDHPSAGFPSPSTSYLVMLTLDVLTDFPNLPVEVNINWWNESNAFSPSSPLTEKLLSTSFEFVCWTEVPLTMLDPNLTQSQMGTRKGIFRSTNASKFPWAGIFDTPAPRPVTLLGLVETMEGQWGNERSYFTPVYNLGDGKKTSFLPE
jgi:hypothetical protein